MPDREITIDREFQSRLFPQTQAETALLEESIAKEGCRDSLVAWKSPDGRCILIDGHHRFEICERLGISYSVDEINFADKEAAKDWMDRNQAGRRNCPPEDFKILCGWIYNRRKKSAHDGGKGKSRSGDQIEHHLQDKTADEVAAELNVSAPTVKRNGQRAEVYDAMLRAGGEEAATASKKIPQAEIARIASAVRKGDGDVVEAAAESLVATRATHVSQNTGFQEWYTPPEFIESAREVMGGIDTDPASSDVAQRNVKAKSFFTAEDDGLSKGWSGRVWMNPPYTSGLVDKFLDKLCGHVKDGSVSSAIVLVNNATDTKWFQGAAECAGAICFPKGRIRFLREGGELGAPLQGQAFLYFGDDVQRFCDVFSKYGFVGVVQ